MIPWWAGVILFFCGALFGLLVLALVSADRGND